MNADNRLRQKIDKLCRKLQFTPCKKVYDSSPVGTLLQLAVGERILPKTGKRPNIAYLLLDVVSERRNYQTEYFQWVHPVSGEVCKYVYSIGEVDIIYPTIRPTGILQMYYTIRFDHIDDIVHVQQDIAKYIQHCDKLKEQCQDELDNISGILEI